MKHDPGSMCALLLLAGALGRLLPNILMPRKLRRASASRSSPGATHTELKLSPLELITNLSPERNEEYRIGKGDEITIDFAGRPEMQAKLIVGPDGRITLPLAGDIHGSRAHARRGGQSHRVCIDRILFQPCCPGRCLQYTANRVVLLGAVDHPGIYAFDGTPTLLEVLARGGVEAGPNLQVNTEK